MKFQSTLSLRRATDFSHCFNLVGRNISIHALLAESDVAFAGRRAGTAEFQSTLSLRRATEHYAGIIAWISISIHALLAESDFPGPRRTTLLANFNPRSPCGERRKNPFEGGTRP